MTNSGHMVTGILVEGHMHGIPQCLAEWALESHSDRGFNLWLLTKYVMKFLELSEVGTLDIMVQPAL